MKPHQSVEMENNQFNLHDEVEVPFCQSLDGSVCGGGVGGGGLLSELCCVARQFCLKHRWIRGQLMESSGRTWKAWCTEQDYMLTRPLHVFRGILYYNQLIRANVLNRAHGLWSGWVPGFGCVPLRK